MYDNIDKNPVKSYKTMVQEYVQHNTKQTPVYIDSEVEIDDR
jgi:dsRNA-specific ribonuclease